MPTTAQEVYNQVVCHLSSGERLRLATIIRPLAKIKNLPLGEESGASSQ